MGKGTLYLPYATSLRMSDLGYTNKEQDNLSISYDSLDKFLQGMHNAINMPSSNFEKIGVKVDGEFRQLNANVLQIENEFYSPIRAKRVTLDGEKPSQALARAGVEYIEVRALDVNPYSAIGIDASQVRFLDMFLLYCLLSDSPLSEEGEEAEISANLNRVILEGRKPGLELSNNGHSVLLTDWMKQMFSSLSSIAELLDSEGENHYRQALDTWLAAVNDPDLTLSGRVMSHLLESQIDHGCWVKSLAKQYHKTLNEYELPEQVVARYKQDALDSLTKQAKMEAESSQSFEAFLQDYFRDETSDKSAQKVAIPS